MGKSQLSEQVPYLVIVAVVAVVAVVSLVLNNGGSVQGAAVGICAEGNTGTGDMFLKQHVVLPNGEKVWDRCSSDGNSVYEATCATGKVAGDSGWLPCPEGCENGACFRPGRNPYS